MDEKHTLDYQLIPLDTIALPAVPIRTVEDPAALEELTRSIRERGVLVPIIVRSDLDGYLLIAGARRVAAARAAGLVSIPAALVLADDNWECWARLCENRLREPLTAYDEARYLAHRISANQCTQKEMADVLGVGQNWVSQRIRLLEWPEDVLSAVREGKLGFAVGRELGGIASDTYRRLSVEQAVRSGCSVRQAAEWRKAAPTDVRAGPQPEELRLDTGVVGRVLGEPGKCGNCGVPFEGVPPMVFHLCEKCMQALEGGLTGGPIGPEPEGAST